MVKQFNVGDVVELMGGGQQLVVIAHEVHSPSREREQVQVAWFEPRGQLRREWLPRKALKLVEAKRPSLHLQ